jgi:hypothetical protein
LPGITSKKLKFFQINEENKLFKEGKATFYEKLNEHSDVPKDLFEKEFEGAIDPVNGRGLGAILPDKEEWFTHPDLEDLYSRQTPPSSYDATAKGIEIGIGIGVGGGIGVGIGIGIGISIKN